MLADLLALLWAPFLMCLVLTGIHAYLGVHVLAREVVFVDIALAQIAALGATGGIPVRSRDGHLGIVRLRAVRDDPRRPRPRADAEPAPARLPEAIIGVVYAVSAAAAVLVADRALTARNRCKTMLARQSPGGAAPEVVKVAILYASIGLLHWICRRPFFLISTDPDTGVSRRLAGAALGFSVLRVVRRRRHQLRCGSPASCSCSRT